MFETIRECTLTKDLVCSMFTISENAAPMATMEMDPQCNCEQQEYQDFYSLTLSDLQHQHDQCKGWSIARRDIFKLILNILTHPFGNKYFLKSISNSQNVVNSLKSFPEHNKK